MCGWCMGRRRARGRGIFYTTPEDRLQEMLAGVDESLMIAAHTHLALDRVTGRRRILNPGTVGAPLDGHTGASYLILESDDGSWRPTFRRIAYDNSSLYEAFDRSGFVDRCGATALLIIAEFRTSRPLVYPFNRWKRAHYGDEPETIAMAEEFLRLDVAAMWPYMPPEYSNGFEQSVAEATRAQE